MRPFADAAHTAKPPREAPPAPRPAAASRPGARTKCARDPTI